MLMFLRGLVACPMPTKLTVQQCAICGKAPNQEPTKGEDTLCNECLSGPSHTIQVYESEGGGVAVLWQPCVQLTHKQRADARDVHHLASREGGN